MTEPYPFAVPGHEFTGKRVLVTGGTKGVGQAIVSGADYALDGGTLPTL